MSIRAGKRHRRASGTRPAGLVALRHPVRAERLRDPTAMARDRPGSHLQLVHLVCMPPKRVFAQSCPRLIPALGGMPLCRRDRLSLVCCRRRVRAGQTPSLQGYKHS